MNLKPLNNKEAKRIKQILQDQFGFEQEFDYVFFISDKNRLYLSNTDIKNVDFSGINVNTMGLYFGELGDNEIRLSIEGSQLIGPFATKNVVETKDPEKWMRGHEFEFEENAEIVDSKTHKKSRPVIDNKYLIVKAGDDFMGSGKIKDGWVMNYVSKTRRIDT